MAARGYKVFISYSRANEDRKNRLIVHLSTLRADGTISVWHDRCIEAGDLWREELNRAMSEAEVALFLLSDDFFDSGFIQDVEVPRMLERHHAEGVAIIPIVVDYCSWKNVKWLNQFQVLPEDGNPVTAQRPHSKAWTQVAQGLRQRLEKKPPHKAISKPVVTVERRREWEWSGIDDTLIWEPVAAGGWTEWVTRSLLRPFIWVHRLLLKLPIARRGFGMKSVEVLQEVPESVTLSLQKLLQALPGQTGKLFGRDEAIGWLDDAYAGSQVGVLALVGFGGMGKSALVHHWLENHDFTADGVTRFLGCSFYSQGTREQAGSSDQFLIQALESLGESVPGQMSAWNRGQRLAELVGSKPTVLVLDGLEPLQYGPGPHNLEGWLKDPGIHGLLAGLAAKPGQSFCIVTSRLNLTDDDLQAASCVQKPVEELSPAAVRELLSYRGVRGTDDELDDAAEYLGRHPLALVLAAEYLHTFAEGQANRVKEIPLLSEETKEGRHAKSVMEAYEVALRRDGDPLDLELLGLLGLFDRPAKWEWLKALCAPPAIPSITEQLVSASDRDLRESIARLCQWGMLADPGFVEDPELDAHPLIREYFGEKLKRDNEAGWREAHGRIFDHLSSTTKEFPETISEMEPLYQAVAHGCKAGRYQKTLKEVYTKRISRGDQFYGNARLGAVGVDLSAITGFFDHAWHQPVSTLEEPDKAFVLNQAGFDLRAMGRLPEAVQPSRSSLDVYESLEDWEHAAINAGRLSSLYMTMGRGSETLDYARKSVELADRSDNIHQQIIRRAVLGDALHWTGCLLEAKVMFEKAEKIQRERFPDRPYLYSGPGFWYCDLLLSQEAYLEVQLRADWALNFAETGDDPLAIALTHLSWGRAHLIQSLSERTKDFDRASGHLDNAVTGLRQARRLDYLPFGLLARIQLHRVKGELDLAHDTLNETMSIAKYGGMGQHQADCHLEYARLYLAQGQKDKARESLATAKEMIKRMGYHRRDKEVAELEAML